MFECKVCWINVCRNRVFVFLDSLDECRQIVNGNSNYYSCVIDNDVIADFEFSFVYYMIGNDCVLLACFNSVPMFLRVGVRGMILVIEIPISRRGGGGHLICALMADGGLEAAFFELAFFFATIRS